MRSCLILDVAAGRDLMAALDCGADALMLRLGPGVECDARRRARKQARAVILAAREKTNAPQTFVEIAPAESEIVEADLDSFIDAAPDGVVLQACGGRISLRQLSVKLAVREAEAGLPDGAISIAAFAGGAPAAALALGTIAGATTRLAALGFDESGLRAALSLVEGAAAPIAAARAYVVLAAAAAGVPALAAPVALGEEEAYIAARRDGFSGAMALEAAQIAHIHAVFPEPRIDKRP